MKITLKKNVFLLIFSGFIVTHNSCKLTNPDEPVPAYIRISEIELKTPADKSQGTSSSGLTDAWVYIDDNLQGVFPMPTRFPILKSGNQKVVVRGGIIQNGIDATRIDYPFYNQWDTTITLTEKNIIGLHPKINGYKSGCKFHFIEDFEGIGLAFEKTSSSPNGIYKVSAQNSIFEGSNSGRFEIINGTVDVTIATVNQYTLPKQGNSVFLEMNYSINQPMEMGILAQNGLQVRQSSVLGLRSTVNSDGVAVWKKVYIDLTQAVSTEIDATGYKIYFYAKQAEGVSNPVFLIDNIKLISF